MKAEFAELCDVLNVTDNIKDISINTASDSAVKVIREDPEEYSNLDGSECQQFISLVRQIFNNDDIKVFFITSMYDIESYDNKDALSVMTRERDRLNLNIAALTEG